MRAFAFYFFIVLLLALFGGFAWLTRHPEAEILRQAEEWPWVGPAAARFRVAYLPRKARGEAETRGPGNRAAQARNSETTAAKDTAPTVSVRPKRYAKQIYLLAGTELRARPAEDAATLHTFDALARAGRIERRGDWYLIDHNGRVGWVLLEGYDEDAEVPYGEDPEPPTPVPARAPDEERLAAARKYLRGRERIASLGAHTLYTDVADDGLISHLDVVAGRLETVYAERYGRRPVGAAAEAVVLFRSDIAYRLVQRDTKRLAGLNAAGHAADGMAVLYAGGRSRSEITGTVIHELVHYLNRRAIGPHLPPWLDEGLADGLALSVVDSEGNIRPSELGGGRVQQEDRWRIDGGLSSLMRLRDAVRAGELPKMADLIDADWESFVRAPDAQLYYATAAFWVRYLIESGGGKRAGLLAFLDAVASGEPPSAEALQSKLDEPWTTLDAGFRAWIESLAEGHELPEAATS